MDIVLCTREEESRTLAHGLILCTEDQAEYLMHFGIKGQKWGERRWQNDDGSLTPEGYIHYGIGKGNKYKAKAEKYQMKANRTQMKANRTQMKADKYRVKADKFTKRAAKQEERGQAQFEKDKKEAEDRNKVD